MNPKFIHQYCTRRELGRFSAAEARCGAKRAEQAFLLLHRHSSAGMSLGCCGPYRGCKRTASLGSSKHSFKQGLQLMRSAARHKPLVKGRGGEESGILRLLLCPSRQRCSAPPAISGIATRVHCCCHAFCVRRCPPPQRQAFEICTIL